MTDNRKDGDPTSDDTIGTGKPTEPIDSGDVLADDPFIDVIPEPVPLISGTSPDQTIQSDQSIGIDGLSGPMVDAAILCETAILSVKQELVDRINYCLSDARSSDQSVCGCITGAIGRILDDVQSTADKCTSRILQSVFGELGYAAQIAAQFGCPFPGQSDLGEQPTEPIQPVFVPDNPVSVDVVFTDPSKLPPTASPLPPLVQPPTSDVPPTVIPPSGDDTTPPAGDPMSSIGSSGSITCPFDKMIGGRCVDTGKTGSVTITTTPGGKAITIDDLIDYKTPSTPSAKCVPYDGPTKCSPDDQPDPIFGWAFRQFGCFDAPFLEPVELKPDLCSFEGLDALANMYDSAMSSKISLTGDQVFWNQYVPQVIARINENTYTSTKCSSVINSILGGASSYFSSTIVGMAEAFMSMSQYGDFLRITSVDAMSPKLAIANIGLALFQRWAGPLPASSTARIEQFNNYYHAPNLPIQSEVDYLYHSGNIDDRTWETMTKINANCPEYRRIIRDMNEGSPRGLDLQIARRRGLITEDEWGEYSSNAGLDNEKFRDLYYDLTEFVPPPTDLMRFMVRDVADKTVVTEYELDTNFTDKYTEELKKYGDANGLSEDVARLYWRAHWDIPSNTALYTMLHRLRPGKPGVTNPVTKDDVLKAIQINDVLPFWAKRLVDISYAPLTRVDVRRMYNLGTIKREEVKSSYLDLGYDEENAERLTRFTEKEKQKSDANSPGMLSKSKTIAAFREGLLSETEFRLLMIGFDVDPSTIPTIIQKVEIERDIANRKLVKNAIRKRFLLGEFQDGQAVSELVNAGLDVQASQQMVQTWSVEVRYKYKPLSVAQLCKLHSRGLITMSEYTRRLENLGYPLADGLKIAMACMADATEKRAKELQAALDKALKAEEKRRKDNEPCRKPPKPMCSANGT